MNEATSIDLERRACLRQPEISIAMKDLKQFDWIYEREEKKPSKGRPQKIYSLKIGFNDIITQIEEQQRKAVDEDLLTDIGAEIKLSEEGQFISFNQSNYRPNN